MPSSSGALPNSLNTLGYPLCASKCMDTALEGSLCDSGDQTCACGNEQFRSSMTSCVTANCSVPDAFMAFNISQTTCGNPARDRARSYTIIATTITIVSSLFVIMRFAYKLFNRIEPGPDDWTVLVAMVVVATIIALSIHGMIPNGFGRDIWTLTPENISSFALYFYLLSIFYFIAVALNKHALILFTLRIFPTQGVQRLLRGTGAFNALLGVVFTITTIFQCLPIKHSWHRFTGTSEGSCCNVNAVSWAYSIMSVALDLWMLGIPLWQLRHLQLHWKRKVGVAIMFCVGTFVTVISVLRFQSLVAFDKSPNITWVNYNITLWSVLELCTGVICTCLPTFRLLLVHIFPGLSGSSYQKSNQYQYPPDGRPTSALGRARGVNIVTSNRLPSGSGSHSGCQGILFQKTFAVHYGDNDETSLVHEMLDLPSTPGS
ncbi:hypothetical protein MRS44_009680 [Fusarium solani]|uniref:uncharacterized protein n=1 Tax=Fusarium solani TaxID=169388 RepID=UPI0032C4A9DB|nr:hypothetical protein MRS44_009680 [Fusarium solani]